MEDHFQGMLDEVLMVAVVVVESREIKVLNGRDPCPEKITKA
jgi:hypothetical protein